MLQLGTPLQKKAQGHQTTKASGLVCAAALQRTSSQQGLGPTPAIGSTQCSLDVVFRLAILYRDVFLMPPSWYFFAFLLEDGHRPMAFDVFLTPFQLILTPFGGVSGSKCDHEAQAGATAPLKGRAWTGWERRACKLGYAQGERECCWSRMDSGNPKWGE